MKEGWMMTTIGEIADIINGGTPSTSVDSYWDGDVQWVTPKDLGQLKCRYISSGERTITIEGVKHSSAKILPPHSLILSSRAPIGYVAINTVPMATNQGCKGIIPSDRVLSEYLFYYLLFCNELLNSLGTGATFKELSGTKLSTVSLPLPSPEEQQRIVGILDAEFEKIDALKANAEQNLQNAKDLFQSALKKELEPKQGWRIERLGNLCTITSSKRIYKNEYVPNGIPFYRTKEVKEISNGQQVSIELFISEERYNEIKRKFGVPQPNDILVSAVGTIGEMMIVRDTKPFYFKDGNLVWLKELVDTTPEYLRYFLQSAINHIKALTIGAAYNALTIEKFQEMKIGLAPSIREQQAIVSHLDKLDNKCKALQNNYIQTIALCDDLKQALLRKAFSGEL